MDTPGSAPGRSGHILSTSHPGAHKAPGERRQRKVAFGAELCIYSPILFHSLYLITHRPILAAAPYVKM